jgi:hypothetical protein
VFSPGPGWQGSVRAAADKHATRRAHGANPAAPGRRRAEQRRIKARDGPVIYGKEKKNANGQTEAGIEREDYFHAGPAGRGPEDIDEEGALVGGDLGLDSIDVLELVMMIEKITESKSTTRSWGEGVRIA